MSVIYFPFRAVSVALHLNRRLWPFTAFKSWIPWERSPRFKYSATTGVTVYLENGGRLEHAQQMAAHESPRTTKLYDRTKDEITIGEVERIQL